MSTDEVAAYYSGRNRAAVAMSNAAKKAGIRKFHFELARRYADLADVSGSEIDPSQRQTALDVQVVQAALSFPRQTGEATFLTPSVACLTSDRLLAPGARGRCRASRAPQLAVKAPLHPEAATNLALAVIASSTAQLLLLDSDCTVIAASETFCRAFQLAPTDVVGRAVQKLGSEEWSIPQLNALLRATGSGTAHVDG
jgi:hypothetical protein